MFKTIKGNIQIKYITYSVEWLLNNKKEKEFEKAIYRANIDYIKNNKVYLQFNYFDTKQWLNLYIYQQNELYGG